MAHIVGRRLDSLTRGIAARLGKSGLKVSRIILGMMSYGDPHWQPWVLGEKETTEHIKFAYEHGVNTFDTANVYSNGLSEVYLGNAIKALNLPREEIVIMTKLFAPVGKPGDGIIWSKPSAELDQMGFVNQHGLSRKHIFDSVKRSLERLQLDYIDVLQCHRFDPDTPIEETMQALHDVVKAGHDYAITNNLTPFISMQNHYSLDHFGVGIIPWSPLARGLLTRPFKSDEVSKRGGTDSCVSLGTHCALISKKRGISMAKVTVAWSVDTIKNLEELIACLQTGTEITLTQEEIQYLEEPYKARSVMGHT
ncbi:aryl-alcohol dehydrogenase [Lactarius hatsudake]|nr:aryl-alcohol dehydrogenase [Lactarius hatsudake]